MLTNLPHCLRAYGFGIQRRWLSHFQGDAAPLPVKHTPLFQYHIL